MGTNNVPRPGKWSIPTTYNGVRYRSKLEAAWAEFFDRHRMKFAYESEGFNFDGVWYLPDFYLPEIKTFVEVKGILDETDKDKLFALAKVEAPKGIMVVLAEAPAGEKYRLVNPTPQDYEDAEPGDYIPVGSFSNEVRLGLCARCNTWYFMEIEQSWHCTACGFREGDATFKTLHEPGSAVGWPIKCPDCGK
jgi:hypothetical protein